MHIHVYTHICMYTHTYIYTRGYFFQGLACAVGGGAKSEIHRAAGSWKLKQE